MEETLGQVIKRIAEERMLNARELGEKINKTKQGVLSIYKRNVVDTDLLITLSVVLDYDFVAHLYKRQQLKKIKQKEIAEWQSKIDTISEQKNQLKDLINSNNRAIASLEKLVKNQEEVIRLLKEKEKFLSSKNKK